MKLTYIEQIENRLAFSRNMYCPSCGGHEYIIVHQIEPAVSGKDWYIRCPQCNFEDAASPTRELAIKRWKRLC